MSTLEEELAKLGETALRIKAERDALLIFLRDIYRDAYVDYKALGKLLTKINKENS